MLLLRHSYSFLQVKLVKLYILYANSFLNVILRDLFEKIKRYCLKLFVNYF